MASTALAMRRQSPPSPTRHGVLDRLLLSIAPQYGLRRIRARIAAQAIARHYDATGGGRRTSGWQRRASDANSAAESSLVALREYSRDLRRNNGWARRAIQVIGGNTVGWGIEAKAAAQSDTVRARATEIWRQWSSTTECDYDGRLTFSGIQRLIAETVAESGEALVVREAATSSDLPVPIRIRVLEPDHLDLSSTPRAAAGNRVVQGIELDPAGRRVAYWIYPDHPGGTSVSPGMQRFTPERVPAERVLHVYRVDRPGQMRGVPWLASAIAKLHDYDDYADARLMQAKIAACFAAFVEDPDGESVAIGEPNESDDSIETLEPGHISYLSPGQRISFATPPSTADHTSFSMTQLRSIASSVGITCEDLTGDYTQVNFSSSRMARLAHWTNVHDWRWNMLIPQACDGVWRWVAGMAAALEGWTEVPTARWAPPPMPSLEPEKEGLAYQRLVRSGAMTIGQMVRERGEDLDEHLAEIAEINARLDAMGIVLDSDPRRVAASGTAQSSDLMPGDG